MEREKHFIVDVLFVLALFGLFAVSALILVTIGANVYKRTVDDMSINYETRTSVSYIAEKIRQNDTLSLSTEGGISITELSGEPALLLEQDINGEAFCTYLYYYDGYLKELFVRKGSFIGSNSLTAGQNIMELSSFSLTQPLSQLISIQMTTPGSTEKQLFIHLRCTTD